MGRVPIRSWWALGAVIGLVSVLASTVTIVVADSFSDVPAGSFFEASIGDITDAGCASGFANGTFRPKEPATRGQFALWSANCLSRSMFDGEQNVSTIDGLGSHEVVNSVNIDVAGVPGHQQFLFASAWMTINDADATCPCTVWFRVHVTDVSDATEQVSDGVEFVTVLVNTNVRGSGSGTFRFPVATDNQYRVTTTARTYFTSSPDSSLGLEDSNLSVWTSPLNNILPGID